MSTTGRPKITIRLEQYEIAQIQAVAYNQGITAAELCRRLILDCIAAHTGEQS